MANLKVDELIKFIVKQIVDAPEMVKIATERVDGNVGKIRIAVATGDVGQVIGKGGKTISAIRRLAGILATVNGEKILIEVEAAAKRNA